MPVTCSNCGNTSHAPGARNCAVCGTPLPAPIALPLKKAAQLAATFPMFVTPQGRRYRLSDTVDTLIGSRGCAITLTDPGISSRHARVFPSGGGFAIEDLAGGIKVNGKPIKAPYPLQPGDTIAVGPISLVYQGPRSAAGALQPQPAAPPPKPAAALPAVAPAIKPPRPQKAAIPLKTWRKDPPLTEGEVTLVDGPHMMDKGNMGGAVGCRRSPGPSHQRHACFPAFHGPTWGTNMVPAHQGLSHGTGCQCADGWSTQLIASARGRHCCLGKGERGEHLHGAGPQLCDKLGDSGEEVI